MGIHGEPGVWRDKIKPADAIADEMIDRLLGDMPLTAGDRVSVLVNSLGATPPEELYIIYRRAAADSTTPAPRSSCRWSAATPPRWK